MAEGTITSSPASSPAARHARCSAAVPLETHTTWGTSSSCASAASNACVRGPMVSQPLFRHSSTAETSSSGIGRVERG